MEFELGEETLEAIASESKTCQGELEDAPKRLTRKLRQKLSLRSLVERPDLASRGKPIREFW